MFRPRLNPIEPPWYGPVCPVVWEGRCREAFLYPDQSAIAHDVLSRVEEERVPMTTDVAGWSRIPAILNFPDTAGFAETYGFGAASGRVWLEGQYLVPRERPSKTLYLFMHPSSTLHLLPMPAALADAGLHVLCAASRYPKNDSGLIMEKVAIDMGAWVKDARARGYLAIAGRRR